MARFEWQTEEEGDWGETVRTDNGEGRHHRLLPLAFLALILLAAGAFVVYRTFHRRVEEAASGVEEQVLASHELVRYAGEQRDRELLATFLSGSDRAWAEAQEQLVQAGALFDRRGLGLHLLPEGVPETAGDDRLRVREVTLSPDLTAAEVVVEQAYAVGVGHGLTETVWLEQTGVYRLGPNRWLYAPREDEAAYWGAWSTVSGRFVTLAFPERDALFARRLAGDLEGRLAQLCNLPELTCPDRYHLDVRLDSDPLWLRAVDEPPPLSVVDEDGDVRLPAPSLVGRPVDQSAYRALARGYLSHILGVALTRDLWEWSCCEHALLYQAVLDEQLRQLNVQAHPLFPADYERLTRQRFELADDLESVWREPRFLTGGDLWLRAQATVAFVAQQNPRVLPATMVSALADAASPWQWLSDSQRVPEAESPEWLRFLYEQAGAMTGVPPTSWPEQEGLLLCRQPGAAGMALYRYRPEDNRLVEAVPGQYFTASQPLPDQSGVFLFAEEGVGSERDILLYQWQGGELTLLWDSEETRVSPLTYNWSRLDPAGEQMTLSVAGREGDTNIILDLQTCLDGECHARVLPGRLLWSPDGQRSLLVQEDALLLADGSGRSPRAAITETVTSPTWLDNETFAFLRAESGSGGPLAVVAVSLEDSQRRTTSGTLLRVDDVRPMLPDSLEAIRISDLQSNPARRDQLLLSVLDMARDQAVTYVLFYNWKSGALDQPLEVQWSWTPAFSPDGRWLAAHGYDQQSGGNVLMLRQLESEDEMRLPQYGWPHTSRWSADGRWLLNAGGSLVRAVAPDYAFQRVLVHDLASCSAVAWVNLAAD